LSRRIASRFRSHCNLGHPLASLAALATKTNEAANEASSCSVVARGRSPSCPHGQSVRDSDRGVVCDCWSATALGALIYLVKQIWSLDLELQIRRELHRVAYEEAKALAARAARDGEKRAWGFRVSDLGNRSTWEFQNWRVDEGALVDWDEFDWFDY